MKPYYQTERGSLFCGDSLALMKELPAESVQLCVTSPPYAILTPKSYGAFPEDGYLEWFLPFAAEIHRLLKEKGSFVLNLGGTFLKGRPAKSLYIHKIVIALVEKLGFSLCQEFTWVKLGALPLPQEWVGVRHIRLKEATEAILWFGKSDYPKASNKRVLCDYATDSKRSKTRAEKNKDRTAEQSNSGHVLNRSKIFKQENPGSKHPTYFTFPRPSDKGYNRHCKEKGLTPHDAKFSPQLPEFFIRFLSDEGDLVLDPFSGSGTVAHVAEGMNREWVAVEQSRDYCEGSLYRFRQKSCF